MMDNKKNDLVNIDLRENTPWTMGMAGLVKWLTWETENILGVSKTTLKRKIIDEVILLRKQGLSEPEVAVIIEKKFEGPHPVEIQKRLRTISEDYLNREFDIFFSLLPSNTINMFFSQVFNREFNNIKWNVVGNSGDLEDSMNMKFLQIDTIAYAPSTNTMVAMELKINAKLTGDQIKKYCFMAAYLEHEKKIEEPVDFKLMIISPDKYTVSNIDEHKKDALRQIKDRDFPKKRVRIEIMERISSRATEILESSQVESTTWQQLGDYFYNIYLSLPDDFHSETYRKLISGFIESLANKNYNEKHKIFVKK
jgi:hypothetical protein